MNKTILIGRLTKDPELRYTPSGVAVATFTLAVDRPFTGEGERQADFISIVVWRKTAEACANHLKKGQKAAVEGRIQVRNYDNNEGRKVYVTEVIAENVEFMTPTQNGQNQNAPNSSSNGGRTGGGGNDGFPSDDDLPF